MDSDKVCVIAILAFILGLLAGALLLNDISSILSGELFGPIATLLAAFFGAYYAFKLNADKERKRKHDEDVVSGMLAAFKLNKMLDQMLEFREQIISPNRNHELNFIKIQAAFGWEYDNIIFDYDRLSFLLEAHKWDSLNDISKAHDMFKSAMQLNESRSRFHVDHVQPILEKASVDEKKKYSKKEIEEILGVRTTLMMQRMTEQLIHIVDNTILYINEVLGNLKKEIIEMENNRGQKNKRGRPEPPPV